MKRNYKMILCYDGTRYYGWERQPNKDTIQGKLEQVLFRMCGEQEPIEVIGAGRTDGGVHARGMCANVFLDTELEEVQIRDYLNRYLPEDIAVKEVRIASDRFHARYLAVGKTYCYTCYCGAVKPVFDRKYVTPLDYTPNLEAMQEAANYLTGKHDYMSFCNLPKMKKSTVRIIDRIDIASHRGYLTFTFHGTGFLRNMIRILVGTLLEVGKGKLRPEQMTEILEAHQRSAAGPLMPPEGLCLMEVDYH